MQSKITLMRIGGYLKKSLLVLGLFCLFTGRINAQVFVNGNLSTGATASSGETAPAGFNWSEVQDGNQNAGFAASIAAGFSVADDFTIPGGSWGLTKFTCYAYSTGYAGATSPFNDIRVQIYNTNPSVGNPAPIFGDQTTNRFSASSSADLYRIFTGLAGTTRKIWKIEANLSITLPAGTYWVEWAVGTAQASNFSPTSTVAGTVTQPGNNALQHTLQGDTWAPILDGPGGTDPQDMPFRIDYTTTVCSGTPTPGNTISSLTTACPGIPFTLSTQNGTGGSGVTYQWQSSTDGTTFTDISGATSSTYSTSLTTDPLYYQVVVICSGGTPGISTPVQVALTPSGSCYCIPATSDCTDGDIITNVTLGTLNNTSDCGTDGFTNYGIDPTVAVPDLVQGIPNQISVTAGGGIFDETVGVWIDYDNSGTFDPSEFTYVGGTAGGTLNANINVPATAPIGLARMRVRVEFFNQIGSGDACLAYQYGETEDYMVNIIPCIQGVITTQPVATTATCGNGATISFAATGTALQYQWQEKVSDTAPWTNLTDGNGISGATTNTLTLATVDGSMNGYQYRAVISGGCTAVDFTSIATLTVAPLVINVDPASYSTCTPISATAPIALSITNVSGGSSSTTTDYASGSVNIPIPDVDDATGITSTITVPALPAGAVITGAKVTMNINHTYAGDLIIALKAPNGNILNLDYALGATGGPGATTGFTNTVISSTGTTALNTGTDPWTGTFAPDAEATPVAGIPTSPTSLGPPAAANVFNFAGLYSVPAGDWTLGIYDYASPDDGTLVDWTLTLTYSTAVTTPFTGVWSPATGLFTDAAGTIPYTGTEETTVYAAPTSTTTYTVTVNNALCPSAPVEIPVTILNPDPTVTVSAAPYIKLLPGLTTTVTAAVNPGASSAATYQWFANGVAIPGANAQTYVANVDAIGTLSVVVTDSTTCTGSATGSITLTDSVSTTLFVYPNPNNGIFQVRYDDRINDVLGKPRILTVYDSKGARVYSKNYVITGIYTRMDVDLSHQPKGVYVIDLTDASGNRLESERVIVH